MVLVAVLIATNACSDRVYTDGPIGESHDDPLMEWCAPHVDGKTTITANNGPLPNHAEVPITITDVSAVGAQGFTIIDVVLTSKNGAVNGAEYPPGPEGKGGPTWDQRVPAEGATIDPGEKWWLVVGLRAEADRAEMERVQVDYRDAAGTRYRYVAASSYSYLPDCDGSWKHG
ncbi:hypothetical protein [Prauserella halophila]|uniref:hypothetical protein n=1 Tax=Prauserella halophila TaxID=185641 RepID=UPI0020A3EADA|nr:hypothetical protein [Prauserella halophila]